MQRNDVGSGEMFPSQYVKFFIDFCTTSKYDAHSVTPMFNIREW